MKNFVVTYMGAATAQQRTDWDQLDEHERREREQRGMQAWGEWVTRNSGSIVDMGTPLGKTKRVSKQGMENIQNSIVAYVIVRANSHDEAAMLFADHPHFSIFPGDSVEIMECLPLPGM